MQSAAKNPVERAASQAVRNADLPRLITGTPFSFSGAVILPPGGSLPVNESAFTNNTGKPIEIHELKFALTASVPAGAVSAMIAVKTVRKAVKRITQAPVPLSLLGIRRGEMAEVSAWGISGEFNGGGTNNGGGLNLGGAVWRVDVPFYLMSGETLLITLSHSNLVVGSILAAVTVSGKIVDQAPPSRWLPYAACYIGTQLDFTQSTFPQQNSNEQHLVNALNVPVKVMRFIGRVPTTYNGIYVEAGSLVPMEVIESSITLTIRSGLGTPVVRFPLPFGRVFESISCALEVPHIAPPGHYYIATINTTPPVGIFVLPNLQAIPMISMVGVREDKP